MRTLALRRLRTGKVTIATWVQAARDASKADEVDRALGKAAHRARSTSDWSEILKALQTIPLASTARFPDWTTRALKVGLAETWSLLIADVARVRWNRLGDRASTKYALDAGLSALVAAPPSRSDPRNPYAHVNRVVDGYAFISIADAFVELLGDWKGHRRCLDAVWERAREERCEYDLVTVAMNLRHLPRRDALLLLEEAEALGHSPAPGRIGVAWRYVGEHRRARRAFRAALDEVKSTRQALSIASMAGSEDREMVFRALDRAGELAACAEDWLEIATEANDASTGEGPIRHALSRAASRAERDTPSPNELLHAVAAGYRVWVGDERASEAIGTVGMKPDDLRERVFRRLPGWDPSAHVLFDWLCRRTPAESLWHIAHAGSSYHANLVHASLSEIVGTGRLPSELSYFTVRALQATARGDGREEPRRARPSSKLWPQR